MKNQTIRHLSAAACAVALLASCGGSDGAATATVSVTVSGLDAAGLVLQDNNGDNLSVSANGVSTFATALAAGAAYSVTVLTQPGAPSQFCSVTNGSGTVSAGGVTNVAVVCTDVARFAYVANGDNTVSQYILDPATGAMASVGTTTALEFAANSRVDAIVADPLGRFVFALDTVHDALTSGSIDRTTGMLTSAGFQGTDLGPTALAVTPDGKFVYVAASGGLITGYAVQANGQVFQIDTPSDILSGNNPTALAVAPGGNLLYAINAGDRTISVFSIDAATGHLTSSGPAIAAGAQPTALALDPSGKSLYVVDNGNAMLNGFGVDASTGLFGAASTTTAVGPATGANSLAMDSKGRFAWVANGVAPAGITAFALDPATGALRSGPAVPAIGVNAVAADPTGRFVYTANGAGRSASAYAVDSGTGALTKVGADAGAGANPQAITLSK